MTKNYDTFAKGDRQMAKIDAANKVHGPKTFARTDELMDVMCQITDALEAAGHPRYDEANDHPALCDNAGDAAKLAYIAEFGPLVGISI